MPSIDDEAIALLKANPNTYYVSTLALLDVNLDEKRSSVIPPAEIERMRQLRTMAEAAFRRALAAGLPFGFATDVPVIPHRLNAREFRTRVALGEKPMASLYRRRASIRKSFIGRTS